MQQHQKLSEQEKTLSSAQEVRGGEKLRPVRKPRHTGRIIAIILFLIIAVSFATYILLPMKLGYTYLEEKHTFYMQRSPQLSIYDDRAGQIIIHQTKTDGAIEVTMITHKAALTPASGLDYGFNSAFVSLHVPGQSDRSGYDDSSFDLDIGIPQNVAVKIQSKRADIGMVGVTAQVNITSTTGPITMHHTMLMGDGKMTTTDGLIGITDDVTFAQGSRYALSTTSGNLTTSFPTNQPLQVDAATEDGKIRCTIPSIIVTDEGQNGQHARGISGGKQAAVNITLHTNTGNIALLKPGDL
jgi:hypothetical protein